MAVDEMQRDRMIPSYWAACEMRLEIYGVACNEADFEDRQMACQSEGRSRN